jgi:hypothetical protein
MTTILIIILVLLLIGAIPAWPYSRSWGAIPERGAGADSPDRDYSVAAARGLNQVWRSLPSSDTGGAAR